MSRLRLILLSMFAVFAISAIASASASAHRFVGPECFKPAVPNNANLKWSTKAKCEAFMPAMGEAGEPWEWEPIANGTKVTGASGVSKLEGEAGGVKVIIECAEDTFSGELEAGGASKGQVKFKTCTVLKKNTKTQLESCVVKQPIEFKFKDLLVGSPVEDEFKPEVAGTPFVTLTIEGEPCKITGSDKVTGTQTCKLPNAATLQATHVIKCEPSGSSLEFAGAPATFESTETVELVPSKNWAIE